MTTATHADRLIDLRRELHRHPEPAWCEFYTTARLVEAVRGVGVVVGREVGEGRPVGRAPTEAVFRGS